MFRLRWLNPFRWRHLHCGTVNRDQVLEQMRVCSAEEQLLSVVIKNKDKLTGEHVGTAVGMLWQFQKEKPELLRNLALVTSHPGFLTLQDLVESKISVMDDSTLVEILYSFRRLKVKSHNSVVQQLVSEAWLRVERFPMASLSKFSICLHDQSLQQSPLMGHIARIVDERLSSIDDARILTTLMINMSPVISIRLRDALLKRVDHLLDTTDDQSYNNPRRVLQFLRNTKYIHRPLLEKCNKLLLLNFDKMDPDNIGIVIGLFQGLQFSNCDFKLAVKQMLVELLDSNTDPLSFTKLFISLAPMASLEIKHRLETTALKLVDELNAQQALALIEALVVIESRNLKLMNRIAFVIQRNLHVYKPAEVTRITRFFFLLRYQDPKLFTELKNFLVNFLQRTVVPYEVTMVVRVFPMLPFPWFDDGSISRINAVLTQCNLYELDSICNAVTKWVRKTPSYLYNTPPLYTNLLQTLNRCGHERLQTANRLDFLLEELKNASGGWFKEMMAEETTITMQRMMDQINWTNVPELSAFLAKINVICPPLLDRIASVTIKDIDEIHYLAIHSILLPFSTLNYDPVQAEEFYNVCIQHVTPHICSIDSHLLILLGYSLARVNCFPEEIVREIFNLDFLGKLDAQLETLPNSLKQQTRRHLMELNRAVCLDCPEFQVPWFHEDYCKKMHSSESGRFSSAQHQIHKILSEVLDGHNFVRVAVVTPYFYTIDFECILDKHLKPLPYSGPHSLQLSERGSVMEQNSDELPPGAQRVSVDFLDTNIFCKNSQHMTGRAQMRKRHLEIMGYRVVQIPHFEWNSMELSSQHAWKEYLRKKIFEELPC